MIYAGGFMCCREEKAQTRKHNEAVFWRLSVLSSFLQDDHAEELLWNVSGYGDICFTRKWFNFM